jgi:hypothetical protein
MALSKPNQVLHVERVGLILAVSFFERSRGLNHGANPMVGCSAGSGLIFFSFNLWVSAPLQPYLGLSIWWSYNWSCKINRVFCLKR